MVSQVWPSVYHSASLPPSAAWSLETSGTSIKYFLRSRALLPVFTVDTRLERVRGGRGRDTQRRQRTFLCRGSFVEAKILVRTLFCPSQLSLFLFFDKCLYSLFAALR